MKFVSNRESSDSGIWQNPLLASTLINKVAPVNWASVSSTPAIGCVSHNIFSLSPLRSTHTLTSLSCFGITTIPAHHGEGSVTFEMTPTFSMRSSSSLTWALIGMGTFHGVNRAYGQAPSRNLMEYSSPRFPIGTPILVVEMGKFQCLHGVPIFTAGCPHLLWKGAPGCLYLCKYRH